MAELKVEKSYPATAEVEAVNLSVEPSEFVALIRAIRCLPTAASSSWKVAVPNTPAITGTELLVVLLLPSWPEILLPQHCTMAFASGAQL